MGVAASGESKIQHVRVEILLAAGAKMLRVRHVNVNRSLRPQVPQIVEQAPYALVAVGTMATARTGPAFEVPAPSACSHDLFCNRLFKMFIRGEALQTNSCEAALDRIPLTVRFSLSKLKGNIKRAVSGRRPSIL
jgi:hypothetical protein